MGSGTVVGDHFPDLRVPNGFGPLGAPRGPWAPKSEATDAAQKRNPPYRKLHFFEKSDCWRFSDPLGTPWDGSKVGPWGPKSYAMGAA